jgi:hypothetical protein
MPSPAPSRDQVHPLVSYTAPSEYVAACHLPDAIVKHLPWGPISPSRHQRRKSTHHRASNARLRSAHSVSHTHDGLLLPTPCGPISSHSHVRDSHSRGFPRHQAGSPHRRVVPSCRWRASSTGELPHRRQIRSPHLQGFGPSSGPLLPAGGLGPLTTRSPPALSTPSGFCPDALATPSRPLRS